MQKLTAESAASQGHSAKKLTSEFVQSLTANGKDQWHPDPGLVGLGLRVTPQGAKLWIARKRVAGELRKATIGSFPELSPSAARREASPVLEAFGQGKDPAIERANRRRAIESNTTTIEMLADRWMAEQVKPKRKPRTAADYDKLFKQHINPAVGRISVAALSWEDVSKFHSSMARKPRRANYAVSTLRALMTYAEKIKLRPPHSNPCKGIEFFRERARERFLSESEIGRAGEAIDTAEREGKIGPHAAAGLRLALFTGARSGEITAAQWFHIDWQRKLIRLPDSKTNEPRTIHLSDAAIEVLRGISRRGPYVIAGAKDGEPYKSLSRAWIIARSYTGLDDVRLHDLRHSYASLAAGRGVSLQMIGKLLGHKVLVTTARYAHLTRDAAAAVNDELGATMAAAIEKKKKAPAQDSTVVKLRRSHRSPREGR
jgi:integrase